MEEEQHSDLEFRVTLDGHILYVAIIKDGTIIQSLSRHFPNQAKDKLQAQFLSFFFAMINLYVREQDDE